MGNSMTVTWGVGLSLYELIEDKYLHGKNLPILDRIGAKPYDEDDEDSLSADDLIEEVAAWVRHTFDQLVVDFAGVTFFTEGNDLVVFGRKTVHVSYQNVIDISEIDFKFEIFDGYDDLCTLAVLCGGSEKDVRRLLNVSYC